VPRKPAKPKSKPKPKAPKRLTTEELAILHEVTLITILRWVKSGCPHTTRKPRKGSKGGRPTHHFDEDQVDEWLGGKGRQTAHTAAIAREKAMRAVVKVEAREKKAGPPQVDPATGATRLDLGLLGYVVRLRIQELELSTQFWGMLQANSNAIREGQPLVYNASAISAHDGLLIRKGTELRHAEEAAAKWLTAHGDLVDAKQISAQYSQLTGSLRDGVLAVSNAFAPLLRPFLRETDDMPELREMMDGFLRDCLAGCPETYARLQDQEGGGK